MNDGGLRLLRKKKHRGRKEGSERRGWVEGRRAAERGWQEAELAGEARRAQGGQREACAPTEHGREHGGRGRGKRSSLPLLPDPLPRDGGHGFEDVMGVGVAYGMDGVRDGAGCVGPSPPGLRLPPVLDGHLASLAFLWAAWGWAPWGHHVALRELGTWAPANPNLLGRPALHGPPWAHNTPAPPQPMPPAGGAPG